MFSHQGYKGKSKPKVMPLPLSPVKVIKSSSFKAARAKAAAAAAAAAASRTYSNASKGSNPNRISIKRELDDDSDDKMTSIETTLNKLSQASKNSRISNGQKITLTDAGKLVLNNFSKDESNNNGASTSGSNGIAANSKLIKVIQTSPSSNLVVLSNGSKMDSGLNKLQQVNKNRHTSSNPNIVTKTIPLDKFPNYMPRGGGQSNQINVKRIVINSPSSGTSNNSSGSNLATLLCQKDEDLRKAQDEIGKLKRELEEYKSLIISKDLEIERLKKQRKATAEASKQTTQSKQQQASIVGNDEESNEDHDL